MRLLVWLMVSLLVSSINAVAGNPFTEDPVADGAHPSGIEELVVVSDGSRMPGLIYMANGAGPHPTVVLLHGFPGNEKNLDIAQLARRAGFNVVFFHYRGAWGADGSYSIRTLDDDTLAVLAYLREPDNARRLRVDSAKLTVLGHSLGGYTALAAGRQDADLVCVGAMSPANMGLWKTGFDAGDLTGDRLTAYADSLFMLADFSGEVMSDQLQRSSMDELDIRGFGPGLAGKSVFMVVGDKDSVTPVDSMFTPTTQAYSKVEGLSLQQHIISGDHSFSWSRVQLSGLILNWLAADCR
ncbi:MAG: alpha/beta fold hydrolase [Halioglobus sp.]